MKITDIQPEHFEITPTTAAIVNFLTTSKRPLFVLGKAGTGKSTLIQYLRSIGEFSNNVVVAPTGRAALNVGGQTIHSFFHLPPWLLNKEELAKTRPNKLWKRIEVLFIDEVSMVRVDLLDAIDFRLKQARDTDRAFGGVRVALFGDFFQLPPVVPEKEGEMLARMGYETPYAFSAKVLADASPAFVELKKIYRQKERGFIQALNNIRSGQNIERTLTVLNRHTCKPHREGALPIVVTATNATADRYNRRAIEALEGAAKTFDGRATGRFDLNKDKLPAPDSLMLKVGARVMALKNDSDRRWVNGSLGVVTNLCDDVVKVQFDHRTDECDLTRVSWENIRYRWDENLQAPFAEVVGAFSQFPLTLAWAMTVHKGQGMTLDDIRVDFDSGAFAAGQVYVALSRARSAAGLSLCRELTESDVIVDPKLVDFHNKIFAAA